MKVLHIYKSFHPEDVGGVERFISTLSKATHSLGVRNTVLTTSDQHQTHEHLQSSASIHCVRKTFEVASCPVSFSLFKYFKQLSQQADILHYHFPWPFADFLHLLANPGRPSLVTYHSDIIRQKFLKLPYLPIMHRFLGKVDRIVATSDNYLNSSKVLQRYKNKCQSILVNINEHTYPTPDVECLNFWRQQLSAPFFLFVGVLRYYKGLDYLLDAVHNTNIPLVIVGSGPQELKLKKKAEKLNLRNVIFTGMISEQDKVALYQLCKAVVVPSHLRSEAFCVTLLEGLMYGKPLISTEIGTGTSFINRHNVSGIVVNPQDPNELRHAMETLLDNETYYQKLCAGAKQHYQEHFSVKDMAQSYVSLYQELVM